MRTESNAHRRSRDTVPRTFVLPSSGTLGTRLRAVDSLLSGKLRVAVGDLLRFVVTY
jgi:hypothetical protein